MGAAARHRLGKLAGVGRTIGNLGAAVRPRGSSDLAVTPAGTAHAGSLRGDHGDAFDRMLIAQALARDWNLAVSEVLFDAFGPSGGAGSGEGPRQASPSAH